MARAIVELHFSAAFLQFASDLQVGRFLPHKVDPDFFQEGRSIDQLGALTLLSVSDSLDRFFIPGSRRRRNTPISAPRSPTTGRWPAPAAGRRCRSASRSSPG